MPKRKKYKMKEEEIQMLVGGIMSNGPEETYNRMRAKAFMVLDEKPNVDQIFLDMSETLLEKARGENEDNAEETSPLFIIYNSLSFMLRKIGHEIYRKYIKKGVKRNDKRFLRLVSYNKDVSLMI